MSFCNVTEVKACRKKKRCQWCVELIEVGQPKIYVSAIWEGDFFTSHFHPECWKALDEWQDRTKEEEWPEGPMKRGSSEHIDQ